MNQEQRSVGQFHELINAYTAGRPSVPPTGVRELRKRLIHEEAAEFDEACDVGDLVAVADAIGDLLVVVYGAALAFGIDAEPIFAEIHRSNMTKGGGPVREDGKQLKGPNYDPPDLEPILLQQFESLHHEEPV